MRQALLEKIQLYRKGNPSDSRSNLEIAKIMAKIKGDSRYQTVMFNRQVALGTLTEQQLKRGYL